ncbi:hypothetical protein [Rhodopirellula sp. MGV]|uniref:hypothetical protein n=1 Tax=Rhodopirellula sp. MGV TaxID=2023130 RepID=UPI000B9712D1|nr:hypothetical protein [Rhodopirellula sp. MGV]OYP36502.1 hypothetical protein CGZ80_08220 [Rhodopirellula sp. MGV]PNY37857.1 hypothetical protein C2E31_04950 [Rhodopirellula baltica]
MFSTGTLATDEAFRVAEAQLPDFMWLHADRFESASPDEWDRLMAGAERCGASEHCCEAADYGSIWNSAGS